MILLNVTCFFGYNRLVAYAMKIWKIIAFLYGQTGSCCRKSGSVCDPCLVRAPPQIRSCKNAKTFFNLLNIGLVLVLHLI
jgi:hypothetical protein